MFGLFKKKKKKTKRYTKRRTVGGRTQVYDNDTGHWIWLATLSSMDDCDESCFESSEATEDYSSYSASVDDYDTVRSPSPSYDSGSSYDGDSSSSYSSSSSYDSGSSGGGCDF